MPPSLSPQQPLNEHMESARVLNEKRSSFGSIVGIVIILLLLAFGALYFWGERLNNESAQEEIAFIPGDNSTQ